MNTERAINQQRINGRAQKRALAKMTPAQEYAACCKAIKAAAATATPAQMRELRAGLARFEKSVGVTRPVKKSVSASSRVSVAERLAGAAAQLEQLQKAVARLGR